MIPYGMTSFNIGLDEVNGGINKDPDDVFRRYLYAPDIPDPDLVIRTSGEFRLSNFLLWESAYAEFWKTDSLWPDFGRDEFDAALEAFGSRDRRMGGRPE